MREGKDSGRGVEIANELSGSGRKCLKITSFMCIFANNYKDTGCVLANELLWNTSMAPPDVFSL